MGGHLRVVEAGGQGVVWGIGYDGTAWVYTGGYGGGCFQGEGRPHPGAEQQRLSAPPPPSRRAVPSSSPAGGPAPTTATLRCSHSAGSWLTGDLHRCQPPQTVLLGPAQEA